MCTSLSYSNSYWRGNRSVVQDHHYNHYHDKYFCDSRISCQHCLIHAYHNITAVFNLHNNTQPDYFDILDNAQVFNRLPFSLHIFFLRPKAGKADKTSKEPRKLYRTLNCLNYSTSPPLTSIACRTNIHFILLTSIKVFSNNCNLS